MYEELIQELKKNAIFDENLNISRIASRKLKLPEFENIKNKIWEQTNFADENDDYRIRLYLIKQQYTYRPRCKTCNKAVSVCKTRYIFPEYCSVGCINRETVKEKTNKHFIEKFGGSPNAHPDVKKKKIQTNLQRYGVEWTTTSEKVSAARVRSNLEKYGVENVFQSPIFREQIRQNNLEKYGGNAPACSEEIRQKMKATTKERYGVENVSRNSELRNKAKSTCIEKYGHQSPLGSPEIREKVIKTNIERYGCENPMQASIPKTSLENLKNTNWLYEHHIQKRWTQSKIAQELSVDVSIINNYLQRAGIDIQYYNNSSQGERDLVEWLEKLNVSVKTNNRQILAPKELDIFLPEFNIAVEYNGIYWHSEKTGNRDSTYHVNKTNLCANKGINLLQFFDYEWINKQEVVKSIIQRNMGLLPLIDDYTVEEITQEQFVLFCNKNSLYHFEGIQRVVGLFVVGLNVACIGIDDKHAYIIIDNQFGEIQSLKNATNFLNKSIMLKIDRRLGTCIKTIPKELYTEEPIFQYVHLGQVKPITEAEISRYPDSVIDRIWNCGYNVYLIP